MKIFFRILDRLLETLVFIFLAGMAGIVAVNVFCRFVMQSSLSWADELAQILLVWMTFLGAALAMRDRKHYTFSYLVQSLPKKTGRFFVLLSELSTIAMTVGLLYWSAKVTVLMRNWIMPATEISRALVYGACPVGTFFMLLYAIRNLFVRGGRITPEASEKIGEEV